MRIWKQFTAFQSLAWNVWRPEALKAGVLRLYWRILHFETQSTKKCLSSATSPLHHVCRFLSPSMVCLVASFSQGSPVWLRMIIFRSKEFHCFFSEYKRCTSSFSNFSIKQTHDVGSWKRFTARMPFFSRVEYNLCHQWGGSWCTVY